MIALKTNSYGRGIQNGRRKIVFNEGYLLLLFVAVFTALYLVRDLMGVYFPDLVFSGICAAAFFLLSDGAMLGMYIFTTTLTVPHNEIMLLYIAVFCLKRLRGGSVRFHKGMFIMVVCLMVLQLTDMTLFSKSNWTAMLYDYITLMLYIIIPLLWCMVDISPVQYRNSMLCYMWGALLGAGIVVVLTANMIGWSELFTSNQFQRLGITENANNAGMQSTYNANQLSGMMVITVSLALVLMEKKKLPVLLSFIGCGIAICVIALTKSRTGLLCTGGTIVLYVLYTLFVARKPIKGCIILITIIGIVALLLYIEPELFDGLMSRFEDQEDITNGRSDLLTIYLQEWMSNPWSLMFGYGIKSFQHVVTAFNVPHNAIADILICWGGVGLLIVLTIIIMFIKNTFSCLDKYDRVLAMIPITVVIVMLMAGQYLTTGFPHLRMCFLIVAMKGLRTDKKNYKSAYVKGRI